MADQQPPANNKASEQDAAMPLFYKKPAPLDAKKHDKLSLKKNFGFGFTVGVNAVPVNMIEMPQVCHDYPIAFSPDDPQNPGTAIPTPVAIVGLRDNENLFVDAQGNWDQDSYIPAYIRRYPFIFSEIPGTDKLTLCVDTSDEIVEESDKQPFFDADGKPSALANNALDFCKSYHAAAQQTIEFSKALAEADILIQREAQINIGDNKRINFSGFRIIDEKKFAELDDDTFLDWRDKGWLPFVYAHLFSGTQWTRLSRLLNEKLRDAAA